MIDLSVSQSNPLTRAFFFTSQPVCLITALYVLPAAFLKQAPIDLQCLCLLYTASFFIYNAERLWSQSTEDLINHPERSLWINKHRLTLNGLCLLAGLLTFLIALQMDPIQQMVIAIAGLPSILYLLPKIKLGSKTLRWRQIPAAKELSVAFSWSFAVSILPLASSPSWLHKSDSLYFLLCTFIAALCNVFICDLKDRKGDALYDVNSLAALKPQLAYKSCYYLCSCTLIFSLSLSFKSPLFLGFVLSFLCLFWLNKKGFYNKLLADLSLVAPCLIALL